MIVALVLLSAGLAAPASSQETSCPEATDAGWSAVARVAGDEAFASFRAEHRLARMAVESIRPLAADERSTCGRLLRFVQEARPAEVPGRWQASLFAVGDHYYVVAEREAGPRRAARPGEVAVSVAALPVIVLDCDFNEVGRIAVVVDS